jgi:hypothetical protein
MIKLFNILNEIINEALPISKAKEFIFNNIKNISYET